MGWIASFRLLARRPALSLLAILTTALAVGANTAIFSVARAVFLRPLGFPDENRVVEIQDCSESFYRKMQASGRNLKDPRGCISVSGALYQDLLAQAGSYEVLGAMNFNTEIVALTGLSEPALVRGYRVTPAFFRALGTPPLVGRWFDEYGVSAAPEREVVLSYGLWAGRFGKDRTVVGRDIELAGAAYRVVGVMPAGFSYPGQTQLWLPHPFGTPAYTAQYSARNLILIGRLKAGVGVGAAQAEAAAISARAAGINPKHNQGWTARVGGLVEEMTFLHRRAFLILTAAVGFLLLIACANLSSLLLASLEGRSHEMAIRMALGANRRLLFRQIVGESVALSLAGGCLGLPLVWWGVDLLRPLIPADVPRAGDVRVDLQVALFCLGASLLTGLVFGLLPALRAPEAGLGGMMRSGAGRTTTRGGARLRGALVSVQVAFAVVLLAGAGLLLNTLHRLTGQDLGFRPDRLLVAQVPLTQERYQGPQRKVAFMEDLVERVARQPGVLSAGAGFPLPLTGDQAGRNIEIEGRAEAESPTVQYRSVSPDFFAAMSIPLLHGRLFTGADRDGTPPVCIVNRTMALRILGSENALGRHVRLDNPFARQQGRWTPGPWGEVVGVVADVRQQSLDKESGPELYVPWFQAPYSSRFTLAVRHTGNREPLAVALRRVVAQIDPSQPLGEIASMDELISRSTMDRRFPLVLFSVFGVLALGIAAVGIYGVVNHSVASRTQEIGIRIALGARQGEVLAMMLGQAMAPVAAGLAAGLGLAWIGTRWLEGLLYGVPPNDPLTLAAACAVLAAVSLLASLAPSRRACRTNPVDALRAN